VWLPSTIRRSFSHPCFRCRGDASPCPSSCIVVIFFNLDSKTNSSAALLCATFERNFAFCARWGMAIVVNRLKGTPFSTRLVSTYLVHIKRVFLVRHSKDKTKKNEDSLDFCNIVESRVSYEVNNVFFTKFKKVTA
jgi:hypothetical protein